MTRAHVSALLVALAMSATACSEHSTGWDWNRMRSQPRYDTYGRGTFYADGKAMHAPPPGTVPRDADATVPSMADTARGRQRFDIFCAACHGVRGDGVSLVAHNMDAPLPPSLLSATMRSFASGRIDTIIATGSGRMPAFAADISSADRVAVIAYLRTLQDQAAAAASRP